MTVLIVPVHPGIIDPRTARPLPAEGARVEVTTYWQRRLALGEVRIVDDTPAPAPAPKRKPS